MKYHIIIYIVLIIFFSTIGVVSFQMFKKSQNEKLNLTKLENYTKELFTIINSMTNLKCITPELKSANELIKTNNIEAENIIKEIAISGKAASPTSIKTYNDSYQKYSELYSKLSDCSIYCSQADSKTGNCVCPTTFPIPVQVGDKLYCTNEDCTRIPNATFMPSSSSDPSKNKCECQTGYSKDAIGGSYCYSNEITNKINTYNDNIQNAINSINNSTTLNVFGTYDKLNIITNSDVPSDYVIKSTFTKLSSIDCANECLQDTSSNSFTFDVNTQKCNLYSSSPSISEISDIQGTKVVGTKNPRV